MATRGRPPKPIERKIAEGNPGKRPLATPLAVSTPTKVPTAPSTLTVVGKKMWKEIWGSASSWLAESDGIVIRELCDVYEEKEFLRASLKSGETPRTYMIQNGTVVTHPYVQQLKDSRAVFLNLLKEIGFTPVERTRLGMMEAATDDAAELIRRMDERRAERAARSGDS